MAWRRTTVKTFLVAIAITSVLSACSDGQSGNQREDDLPSQRTCTWTQSAPTVDAKAAIAAIGGLFDTAGSLEPDRWMRNPQIRLVVVAEVQDFIQGATFPGSFNPDAKTVVMRVRVKEVAKGKAPDSGLIHVYLGIVGKADEANESIRPGTLVALYLETFANRPRLRNEVAMPADAVLWGVSPLGFVAANGRDEGVVFPYLGENSPTKTFESQLPSSIRNRPHC